MLPWWTRQGTNEGVEWAWKILDRLALESSENIYEDDIEMQLRKKLMTDWLNFTINAWRLLVEKESEAQKSETPLIMTAEQVLEKVDDFGSHILPDVQTYTMIVDAKITQAPSEAIQFADVSWSECTKNPKGIIK